jgi:hypothetical protein
MRPTLFVLVMTCAAVAPAIAQDSHDPDSRLVIRERDVIRALPPTIVKEKVVLRAYQGRNRGPEQTDRFSRKIRIGRDGRLSVANISGDIVVNTGAGDEVTIEAIKRTTGDRDELARVQILVDERPGRVDIRTEHEQYRDRRDRRGDHVSVDYTITMPATASADVHSVSGSLKVTAVRGAVRAETISGDVTIADAPKVELAKSVSGNVTLSGVASDGDLSAGSVSGNVIARSLKVHALDLNSVSGNLRVTDVTCDRLAAKSVSGGVEYDGAITRGGTYDFNVHSGTVRLILADPAGFVLNANSFSGSVRSDLPMTIGGDRDRDRRGRGDIMRNRSMRATYGDGSATVTVRTFSGDIIIAKR